MGISLGLGLSTSNYNVFDPTNIDKLAFWLQNGKGIDNETWEDSSSNNNNAGQTEEDNQGTVSNGGYTLGNGVESFYNLTASVGIAERQGFAFAIVTDNISGTNNTFFSDSANELIQIRNSERLSISTNAPSNVVTDIIVPSGTLGNQKQIILLNRSVGAPATYTMFRNGTSVTIDGDNSVNLTNGNGFDFDTLFARNVPAAPTNFYNGKVLELLFFTKGLTTSEINDINDYLKEKHEL